MCPECRHRRTCVCTARESRALMADDWSCTPIENLTQRRCKASIIGWSGPRLALPMGRRATRLPQSKISSCKGQHSTVRRKQALTSTRREGIAIRTASRLVHWKHDDHIHHTGTVGSPCRGRLSLYTPRAPEVAGRRRSKCTHPPPLFSHHSIRGKSLRLAASPAVRKPRHGWCPLTFYDDDDEEEAVPPRIPDNAIGRAEMSASSPAAASGSGRKDCYGPSTPCLPLPHYYNYYYAPSVEFCSYKAGSDLRSVIGIA